MSRVRVKRRNISLDMTAMCDMAFLLLAFFMLATKFKPNESANVNIPSSISKKDMQDSSIAVISVEASGRVFFGMDGESNRVRLLEKVGEKYNLTFTEDEKHEFAILNSFSSNVKGLKNYLNTDKDERKKMVAGIPSDTSQNELREWIRYARRVDPDIKVAIKADANVDYPVVESIIETLKELNITKFKFITSLEAK